MDFAINHMTVPWATWSELLDVAAKLGCVGVEFRDDLPTPLFSGEHPNVVSKAAQEAGLRILGLSQVYPFNQWSEAIRQEVFALIETTQACGAETISLIPRNDGLATGSSERRQALHQALLNIKPMLAGTGLTALIEPLGFQRASLRLKREAEEAIEAVDGQTEFKLVHDTFHHFLAEEREVFAEWTGLVHISGVVDPSIDTHHMEDEHRILVDARDRLGNIEQLRALTAAGYTGPVSFEAFAPEVHQHSDPVAQLAASIDFITERLHQ